MNHRKSNPRPSGLQYVASTNCATAYTNSLISEAIFYIRQTGVTVGTRRTLCTSHVYRLQNAYWLIPAKARPTELFCGHSLPGIAGSNPAGGTDVCPLYRGVLLIV